MFITVVYLIVILVALYIIYTVSGLKWYLRVAREINKIDGPPALPILGNIPQVVGTPERIFKNLRHLINLHAPTFRAWLGVWPSINTLSPEDAEIILSTTKHSTKSAIYSLGYCFLKTGLLTSSGKKWHERRKILTPSFHSPVLVKFLEIFNKHTVELVEALRKTNANEVDVVPIISDYTLHCICETAMGTSLSEDHETHSTYKNSIKQLAEIFVARMLNPLLLINPIFDRTEKGAKCSRLCEYLHGFSASVIKKRTEIYQEKLKCNKSVEEAAEDVFRKEKMAMLDVLLSAKFNHGSISDQGVQEEVDTFIFEGYDTTSVSLSYTLMLLACNKHCQDKIYEEINEVLQDLTKMPTYNEINELKYLERCIKESLRLFPSVPMISRVCDGMKTKGGYEIPEGVMANVLIYDMHRRADLFPNPEKFDPDRFLPENTVARHPFAYIPFSAGPRNCIGQRFAMLEMKCCLSAIVKNFVLEPVDTPNTIVLIPDVVLRTRDGVKVKFVRRKQNSFNI